MQYKFKQFIQLIQEQQFYKAHEVLEELWFPYRRSKESKILIIKGFINASVALELQRLGRRENALKVWQNYLKYKKLIKNDPLFEEVATFLDRCYEQYLS